MQQTTPKSLALRIAISSTSLLLFLAAIVLFCAFKTTSLGDDFLKQLGLTKESADQRITDGMLGGYVNVYGIRNAKNIALGDRKAVVFDLLAYTRGQTTSDAFVKRYNAVRGQYKPKENIAPTPEQDRATSIANAKDALAKMEEALKRAQADYKPMFEEAVKTAKEDLEQQEDPANKSQALYAKNYPELARSFKEDYAQQLANWEKKYPANQLLYVKMRLQEFMDATKDVDYSAELTTKSNGKKYFVNPVYERKDSRWKTAFRAGKEVIEPARAFVQNWMAEIK